MTVVGRKIQIIAGLIIVFSMGVVFLSHAQDDERVIQFSGVVVEQDSTSGIPGVHVYVPGKRRGTSANFYGYFSFPVLVGDTVIFSSVGYQRKRYIIPNTQDDMLTVIVPMKADTIILDETIVMPYPTEELFKEAILAMRPSEDKDYVTMQNNIDPVTLAEMYRQLPNDASMNYSYLVQQQHDYLFDAYGPRSNQLLNPFAWADFFKSLKKKK